MHINITKSETGNNKGGSGQLVTYLEKENRLAEKESNSLQPEYWFNYERQDIQPYEVRSGIDNNVAKLSRDDAKFFLINISPSEKELTYLKQQYGAEKTKDYLKQYANEVMNAYAMNFERKGIDSNKDLVYFGKVEQHRYYTYKDPEVKAGRAKKGDVKPGEQMHVQLIVSRKDAGNSIKLSPLNNSRGSNATHSQKVGQFDRVLFKQVSELLFDRMFDYERPISESFKHANTMKNGSYEQKAELKEQIRAEKINQPGGLPHYSQKSLLSVLLEEGPYISAVPDQDDRFRRKRKKKGLSR